MILPTKHVPPSRSLLAAGATVLAGLTTPASVSELWHRVSKDRSVGEFRHFLLALDLLYMLGAIDFRDGLLQREIT